jgi:hypothetical protein
MEELFKDAAGSKDRLAGAVVTSGSAGTTAVGDYLKEVFPYSKFGAGEALQCPTLLWNGFGDHRIEGIGDKHVPWVHNVRNTDLVFAVDDSVCMAMIRFCNEPAGKKYLRGIGVGEADVEKLSLMGISGAANVSMAIKMAKYYELTENDIILTVFTDSMEMYGSRLAEMNEAQRAAGKGEYTETQAAVEHARYVLGMGIDGMQELNYYDRKRIHNLKYYTWVEQQGKTSEELNAQWYDRDYWKNIHKTAGAIDAKIDAFNKMTGAGD